MLSVQQPKRKRATYPDDVIKVVTDLTVLHGLAAGVRSYNLTHAGDPVPMETAKHWNRYFVWNQQYKTAQILTATERAR